jgi:glycogen operon protein
MLVMTEKPETGMTNAQRPGRSSPLVATVMDGGVNFSLFSRTASGVELLFFDREDDATPSRPLAIDPAKTGPGRRLGGGAVYEP